MTSEDIRSELDKEPFVPFRLHLVSGKTIDVTMSGMGWMLQNAVMVLHRAGGNDREGYDIVSLRNIERLEQMEKNPSNR